MDHDRLAKLLFETFFEDFLGPFVPDLAAGLEPGSLVSLNADVLPEVFGQGDRRSDLVMRGRVRGREACFLVRLELQSRHDPTLPERMYRYHQRLEVKHGLDVYPLVVFTHGRSRKPQPDTYERRLAGLDVLRFRYRVIQLNRLRWRDHLGPLNPVTTALLPLMHVEPGETDEDKMGELDPLCPADTCARRSPPPHPRRLPAGLRRPRPRPTRRADPNRAQGDPRDARPRRRRPLLAARAFQRVAGATGA